MAVFLGSQYLSDLSDAQTRTSGTWRTLAHAVLHPVDEDAFNTFMIRHLSRPAGALLDRALSVVMRDAPAGAPHFVLRDNGQFLINDDHHSGNRTWVRDATILPIQAHYFHRLLEWARERHVKTVLVLPPMLDRELESYPAGTASAFDRWFSKTAQDVGAVYVKYGVRPEFTSRDFTDGTHLTREAADRFSQMLDVQLATLGIFR
jgi:hypothetical protein